MSIGKKQGRHTGGPQTIINLNVISNSFLKVIAGVFWKLTGGFTVESDVE